MQRALTVVGGLTLLSWLSHPLKRLRVNSQERSGLQTIEQSLKIDPFIVGRLNFGMGG
jgi:hypothetical protein